jgi:hypothetical protein
MTATATLRNQYCHKIAAASRAAALHRKSIRRAPPSTQSCRRSPHTA